MGLNWKLFAFLLLLAVFAAFASAGSRRGRGGPGFSGRLSRLNRPWLNRPRLNRPKEVKRTRPPGDRYTWTQALNSEGVSVKTEVFVPEAEDGVRSTVVYVMTWGNRRARISPSETLYDFTADNTEPIAVTRLGRYCIVRATSLSLDKIVEAAQSLHGSTHDIVPSEVEVVSRGDTAEGNLATPNERVERFCRYAKVVEVNEGTSSSSRYRKTFVTFNEEITFTPDVRGRKG